jgi:hypothetical protein
LSVSSDAAESRRGETTGQLTVTDLLRREGVKPAKKLPVMRNRSVVKPAESGQRREFADFDGDDASTVQLPVAKLLRRESELPAQARTGKRKTVTVAAGVAALFGLAAVAFGVIQPHDEAALTAAGPGGDNSAGLAPTTPATQPGLSTSSSGPVLDEAKTAAEPVSPSEPAPPRTAPKSTQPGGTTPRTSPSATSSGSVTSTGPTTTTVDTSATPTTPRAETSEPTNPVQTQPTPAPSSTPTTATPTPTNTDLLGSVTGLADGVVNGVLGGVLGG